MLNPAKMCVLNRKNVIGKYEKMKIYLQIFAILYVIQYIKCTIMMICNKKTILEAKFMNNSKLTVTLIFILT